LSFQSLNLSDRGPYKKAVVYMANYKNLYLVVIVGGYIRDKRLVT